MYVMFSFRIQIWVKIQYRAIYHMLMFKFQSEEKYLKSDH